MKETYVFLKCTQYIEFRNSGYLYIYESVGTRTIVIQRALCKMFSFLHSGLHPEARNAEKSNW